MQMRVYEFLYNRYRTDIQTYKDPRRSLASIQQYIIKMVGNHYSTIDDEHDISEVLILLKRQVQPSDWVQRKEILSKYQSTHNSTDRTDI